MRKACTIIACCAFFALVAEAAEYTSKYDNINVDQILHNERILNNYIKCMLDQGSCTAEGRELKKTLPDALKTGCTKCNPKQKDTAAKVIKFLVDNKPKEWGLLEKKYDPDGNFRKRYEAQGYKL